MRCVKNCQEKSYQAFNMYMRVQYNFSQKQDWRNYIDISKYTGMEVEHGSNTADKYTMSHRANLGHFDPHADAQTNYRDFRALEDRKNMDLRIRNNLQDMMKY